MRVDSDELRRCRILIGSALSVGFLTFMLSLARLLAEGWDSFLGWVFTAVSLLMLSLPIILRVTKSTFLVGSLLPAIGACTLIFMATYEGGLDSEAIYWFPFAPLIAAFFVNAFASIAFGLLMLIALAGIYFTQLSGMIFPSPNPADVASLLKLISATAAVIFGASVAWLYETNRRKSETALRNSNSRTEAIISAMPDSMFLLNNEGEILEIKTTSGIDILNALLRVHVLNNFTVMDLFSHDDKERISAHLKRAISFGTIQMEEYILDVEGQPLSLEVRIVPIAKDEVLAIIRDVTYLRNIERMKNEFVSTVSHELRSPLTAIIGYIGILSDGLIPGIPKKAKDMIDNTNSNALRLNHLVDDLLDFQKISSGGIHYSMKNSEIGAFVKNSIELNKGYASKYNVQLTLDNQIDNTNVWMDESRMHQVMANLISNAIKYSPKGEKVSVQLICNNDQINISVTDKGNGIPEEFRDKVFEKFTQSNASDTRKAGGTGLGLSITKVIVEAHGGSVDFDTKIGVGTSFNLHLPISIN